MVTPSNTYSRPGSSFGRPGEERPSNLASERTEKAQVSTTPPKTGDRTSAFLAPNTGGVGKTSDLQRSAQGAAAQPRFTTPAPAQPSPRFSSLAARNANGEQPTPKERTFTRFTPLNKDTQPAAKQPMTSISSLRPQPALQKPGLTASSIFRPKFGTATTQTAASPFRKDLTITDEEFVLLRDFIYKQCGIFIAENRKYLVENRLSNRIRELNLKSYSEYYKFLRFDANRAAELNKLFEMVTTNETSFFRNPPQLRTFQNIILRGILDKCRKAGQRKLRIWSAGCSTGEEPYTLAIILNEELKSEIRSWDIKITANDLSPAVLAAAQRGIYNDYALRTTPKEIIQKYFTQDGKIQKIKPEVKRLVSFGQINLNDREQLKRVERSHIVFCRNVIIYFDDDMKRRVINAFYDNLLPGGVLLIGHSETLHNISRAFQLEHHPGTIVYRKAE